MSTSAVAILNEVATEAEVAAPSYFVDLVDLKTTVQSEVAAPKLRDDFSILYHAITPRSVLKEIWTVYPNEPVRNAICLQPYRILHNEILAQLQATVTLETTPEGEEIALRTAFEAVEKEIANTSTCVSRGLATIPISEAFAYKARLIYQRLAQSVFIAMNGQAGMELSVDENQEITRAMRGLVPSGLLSEQQKTACFRLCLARLYNKRVQAEAEQIVVRAIGRIAARKDAPFRELPYHTPENAVAMFMTGGVASGKGTTVDMVAGALERNGIMWDTVVHHNADRLKAFLFNSTDNPKAFSQFTYEESLWIKERIIALIAKKSQEQGGNKPHFIHDQTKLKPEELREAVAHYGEVLIIAVSTDASSAIKRAYLRGSQTKRFEHTEGLLSSHQAVPGEFIRSLAQDVLIGKRVSVTMFSNDVESGQSPEIFAEINMKSMTIIISDTVAMENWIKKQFIDPKASSTAVSYKQGAQTLEDYFKPLTDKGLTLVINPTARVSQIQQSACLLHAIEGHEQESRSVISCG